MTFEAEERWITLLCQPPLLAPDLPAGDRVYPVTIQALVVGPWAVTPSRLLPDARYWTLTAVSSGHRIDEEFCSHAEACLFARELALVLPEPPRPPMPPAARTAARLAVDKAIASCRRARSGCPVDEEALP